MLVKIENIVLLIISFVKANNEISLLTTGVHIYGFLVQAGVQVNYDNSVKRPQHINFIIWSHMRYIDHNPLYITVLFQKQRW